MKISWIKYKNDINSFKMPEALVFDVYKIEDPETTDEKISELIKKNYRMVVVSDEIASFSEDIIKKYNKDKNISIIIATHRE